MFHQFLAYRAPASDQQRKHAFRQTAVLHCLLHHASHQLRSSQVRRVRLGHHRTSRRQRRCGVAARNRERQRKVARAEHRNRPQRNLLRAQIGARCRLAVGHGPVDRRIQPPPLARQRCKQPQLRNRAPTLAFHASARQTGLAHHALQQHIAQVQNALRNRLQQVRPRFQAGRAIRIERFLRQQACRVHILLRALAEPRLQLPARRRVHRINHAPGSAHCARPDQHLTRHLHSRALQLRHIHNPTPPRYETRQGRFGSNRQPGTRYCIALASSRAPDSIVL